MMMHRILVVAVLYSSVAVASAADSIMAIHRTNADNYKDRALAACLAVAYQGSQAGEDADITKSVFLEWTYYDEDKGNQATDQLVEKYLSRNYSTPVEGYAKAEFRLLKCLDMYHSQDLNEQMRKYVPHPNWIGDKPLEQKGK